MYITLLFVHFRFTVGISLPARFALELNVEQVCIKVEILNNRERLVTAAVTEVVCRLAKHMTKGRLNRSLLFNVDDSEKKEQRLQNIC